MVEIAPTDNITALIGRVSMSSLEVSCWEAVLHVVYCLSLAAGGKAPVKSFAGDPAGKSR